MRLLLLVRKLIHYFNLEPELDEFIKIHRNIEKDVVFRGTNLWILIFAIVVASVGLNMNSTAVIIGAMLISPLMGPIIGVGYSIATYNFLLLRKSVRNFIFAVVTSLIASTTYFALSPISTAHSEILARTSPTIYDVLIALFGGLAGIVATSSKNKGNVIPGVAIATALMPPLCTAGYGLATFQFEFFFGALYLFTINSVFIAFSSLVISQMLKFPILSLVEASEKRRVNRWITIVTILVFLPSIYFGYNLVQKERFIENANLYISDVSAFEGNYLLKSNINSDNRSVILIYGGITMNESQKKEIIKKAENFFRKETEIIVEQGLSIDNLSDKFSEAEKLRGELNKLKYVLNEKDNQIDSIYSIKFMGQRIINELGILFPQLQTCSYAETYTFQEKSKGQHLEKTKVIIFSTSKKLTNSDKEKINKWLKERLTAENIKVFYDQ